MWQGSAVLSTDAAALGQVRLDERPVLATEARERVQRLDNTRALRPSAAAARRERHDGDLAIRDRLPALLRVFVRHAAGRVEHIARFHITDLGVHWQAVLRET